MMSCPFSSAKRTTEGLTCPFSGKKEKLSPKDPEPEWFEPCYTVPYISPYYSEIEATLKKFTCEESNPPFYLVNTLFQDPRVCRWRSQPMMVRLILAEELKQGGNRELSLGKLKDAQLNYEHALGLFKYLTKTEETLKVNEDELTDEQEIGSRSGVRKELMRNLAITLIRQKHFDLAFEVLNMSLALWRNDPKASTIRCWLYAEDLKSSSDDIENAIGTLKSLREAEDTEFRKMLHGKLLERKNNDTLELRKFYNKFLTKLLNYAGQPQAYSELEFEHQVLLKMESKYTDVLKFCMEMEKSNVETLSKLQILKGVLARMSFICSISATSPPALLRTIAEEMSISLEDQRLLGVFEGTKRQLIVEAFADGSYDQNLLSYCIEQCMEDRQTALAKTKPEDSEGFFTWQLGLSMFLLIAAAIYYYIDKSNSMLSRMR
eukprot:CAMPEP_0204898406 /NCGR_PEP_ID=MMETSP1397-20131031/1275_1 /ASSEMBLY_ACC=CAM_ASM_000891 /TAXON_ID=49980 /ORGANISM="Climacostomum Climacostomum virens, Strain Stock W-24" /LENGTH=433 /DNA_ID=CAMNT_0052066255 /DNA_START=1 /DNA_END=1302 /DNA_ORIENTATION=-